MGLFQIFKKSSGSGVALKSEQTAPAEAPKDVLATRAAYIEDNVMPFVCGTDFLGLFKSVPEVFFPIDYIASRIAGAHFVLKKTKDDSVVWRNKSMNRLLADPNCVMSFREFVYLHFVYKLTTGNSFIRAAMPDAFKNSSKFEMCDNFWVLPSNEVSIEKPSFEVPLYGVADIEDLVKEYRLSTMGGTLHIEPWQVWHDRDGVLGGEGYLKGESRLRSQVKPISNLIAVYEARNVIYVKRGGLGFLVNQSKDATGNVAMAPDEVKELLEQHFKKYGITNHGQFPYGFSNSPLTFLRTNLSISELMPFDETLADAISIAGAFGIPPVLVPRKDQSTFNNQANAEKSVYTAKIIPLAEQFCQGFSRFVGLEEKGYYLDCDFSTVDCLQQGVREAEATKTSVNNRCKSQFENGLISINDWRAQIGESKLECEEYPEVFDKVKFLMSDEELQYINRIFNHQSSVENGRENQKPAVQNEGK